MPTGAAAAASTSRLGRRWRGLSHALRHRTVPLFRPLMAIRVLRHARRVPSLPRRFRRPYDSPKIPWAAGPPRLPASLRSGPGTRRRPEREARAYENGPLRDHLKVYQDAFMFAQENMWRTFMPVAPRLLRARRLAKDTARRRPAAEPVPAGPGELTAGLKTMAKEIGLSAVGVAEYNPVYTFAGAAERPTRSVVVCVLEQNYETTQTIPSPAAEQAALSTYAELLERSATLCSFLNEHGYEALSDDYEGDAVFIYYGEQAGLGQLGRNGQLLTRAAGSRCRLTLIFTDAPLHFDGPRDFGVPKICDECNICAQRCPSGAIPTFRREYRGVEKSKLNTKRCFPLVAQADGCAICMKTCPVQAYGLDAVVEEYERSGRILGKGTDALEGYDWIDGRRYGPGEKPRLDHGFLFPSFDSTAVPPDQP